jgi:uncharacterized protein (TIGR03435 family)
VAEQGDKDSEPVFDVASVKQLESTPRVASQAALLSAAARQGMSSGLTAEAGGRWLVRAATLRGILQSVYPAYSRPDLIVGGPAWVDSLYFEIDARASDRSTPDEIERMARRLLVDRFKLRVGTTTRPLDVYALTVSRDDKRLGPGMRPPIECDQKPTFGPDGLPIPSVRPRCQVMLNREGDVLLLTGRAGHISELITWLQMRVDRPIVDRTGLANEFAIRFEVPRLLLPEPGGLPTGPSDMITAVREQLGLSMVPRTEPTTVLVIEHVELPTPN